MTAFTLDTSGGVRIPHGDGSILVTWGMPHLSPFAQGYVEAALTTGFDDPLSALNWRAAKYREVVGGPPAKVPTFSDLAPATLAAMLKDCAEDLEIGRRLGGLEDRTSSKAGRAFWIERQEGNLRETPPLALYLGDDGLIYQRETA